MKSAGEKGVASLYSDLLPCEIKDSIPPEDFEFFKNAHEFLPHAHNETTIETNSNAKSKVLYVRNKIPSSANNALTENILIEEIYKSANNLVQYGWKKEAVPIIHEKKSFIARIFDLIFN